MLKNRLAVVIASIVLLVAGSLTALAQGLVTQKLISADQANTIARGAVDKCRADGYHVTVTVIDEDGLLKAFLRDDGSAPHTIDFSRKKAFSALTFRRTSADRQGLGGKSSCSERGWHHRHRRRRTHQGRRRCDWRSRRERSSGRR